MKILDLKSCMNYRVFERSIDRISRFPCVLASNATSRRAEKNRLQQKRSMPIYEYQVRRPGGGCQHCRRPFELIQKIADAPIKRCPACGTQVKKLISPSRARISELPEETVRTQKRIREYERDGMWSHAAELADSHAEKTKDQGLKARALDDYRKAGHDVDTLSGDSSEVF